MEGGGVVGQPTWRKCLAFETQGKRTRREEERSGAEPSREKGCGAE